MWDASIGQVDVDPACLRYRHHVTVLVAVGGRLHCPDCVAEDLRELEVVRAERDTLRAQLTSLEESRDAMQRFITHLAEIQRAAR